MPKKTDPADQLETALRANIKEWRAYLRQVESTDDDELARTVQELVDLLDSAANAAGNISSLLRSAQR